MVCGRDGLTKARSLLRSIGRGRRSELFARGIPVRTARRNRKVSSREHRGARVPPQDAVLFVAEGLRDCALMDHTSTVTLKPLWRCGMAAGRWPTEVPPSASIGRTNDAATSRQTLVN